MVLEIFQVIQCTQKQGIDCDNEYHMYLDRAVLADKCEDSMTQQT